MVALPFTLLFFYVEGGRGLPKKSLGSSPEPKAIQTALEVAKRLGLQNTIHNDLHENDRTGFSYLLMAEFEQTILEFFTNLIMGKEAARQAQQRFAKHSNSTTH